jgi:hypothetical protein
MRLFTSLIVGLALGIGLGLLIGWTVAPVEYVNNPASALDRAYKDDYTVMVAAGFRADQDISGAVERLRVLGVENIPAHVLETTERYITSSRSIDDIRTLVVLYEGLTGRITPLMQPYRPVSVPNS